MRCLYVDLDGTLLGRYGSLLHDGDGAISLLGVRAMEACLRAEVEVVIMSGRRQETVRGPARMLGQASYIFEAGSCLVLDGEEQWLTGEWEPSPPATQSICDQIAATGAPDLLLERFAGRLEYHAPWHVGREVSHLFRGAVDIGEVDALLVEHGHDTLRLVDNGGLSDYEGLRAYHLVPAMVSKATAVAAHMRARGYEPAQCIAVGDSREDLEVAASVGTFWLVANAHDRDPALLDGAPPNVRVAEGAHGAGVYEAVVTTLAQRA